MKCQVTKGEWNNSLTSDGRELLPKWVFKYLLIYLTKLWSQYQAWLDPMSSIRDIMWLQRSFKVKGKILKDELREDVYGIGAYVEMPLWEQLKG